MMVLCYWVFNRIDEDAGITVVVEDRHWHHCLLVAEVARLTTTLQ